MTKKRGNQEGGLYRRADGLWCASFTIGYDQGGHRKRRVVYGQTKTEVQKKLLELQSASASGTLSDPKRMRLAEYLKHWLEDVSRPGVRAGTYVNYEAIIRNHIVPHIGGVQLNSLQVSQVQNLYSKLAVDGASPRVREHTHAVLRKALKQAVYSGYIQRNVCDMVQKPRVPKKAMSCFSPNEARKFLEVAEDDRFYALYVLALTTGLRQGEMFGLQWADVDLKQSSISIQRTVYELKGGMSVGEPKTAKGRRKIELPLQTTMALHAHREKMLAEGNHNEWVFCDTLGGLLRRSNFRKRSFDPLLQKAGIKRIRFHDLRHSAATLLLSQGVHPKVVQERLGHAQISITLDIYSHILPSMQKEAASKLDEWMGNSTR